MKIVVTGCEGQLGSEFRFIAEEYPDYSFVFTHRENLDITSKESIEKCLKEYRPNILINCAAYTKVDKAEQDVESAKRVNSDSPTLLANVCKSLDCILIHFSTDYVYHNELRYPLRESDLTNPRGVYAKTKLAGEHNILESCPRSLIIRTSWVYSSFGNNFVKTMLNLGQQRDELTIVNDQVGTPTYARDIAEAIMRMLEQILQPGFDDFGVYNYSNMGKTNWLEFAEKIFELEKIKCVVYPTTTMEYGAPAERPLWSILSKEKIIRVFGIKIPSWEDSLAKCLDELK